MQTSTPVAPAPSLGIREFSRQSGYSEAKVRRAMRELSIKGQFQGRGKATLLNPSEQERLALHIDEIEMQGSDNPPAKAPKTPAPKTSAPKTSTPKTSGSTKPIPKTPPQPSAQQVAEQTEAETEPSEITPAPSETPLSHAHTTTDLDMEHSAVLDQLWEARQAIHSSDSITPPPAPATTEEPPAPAHPVQPAMSQPANPTSPPSIPPNPEPEQQQLSPPVDSQTAPAYYDPYFDAHPAIAPTTQIQPGNHRQTLAPTRLPESYDLGQFRSEETITTLADPGAIAAQAMGAINALVQGMDADIHQQRIHLEETQRAAQTLRLKAKQLQDKKIEYMIQSSTLGQAQQQSTVEIQEALEGIQVLGKSPSDEPTSPSSSPSSPSPSA